MSTDHAVFEIEIKENGEVAFNKLASGAEKFHISGSKAKQTGFELDHTFAKLRDTLIASAGIFEGIAFGKESEELYLKVQRADAEIQASLASTKGAAGVTNAQLKEGAETLYHHSEFTMDNIERMQSVLLTFPKVAAGQFDEASQAIIDTAAKIGGKDADLQGMTIRIAKALQDPAHGMQMLAREGVNFTRAQVKMVAGMVATGHQVEAQKYILHELETEFGGSAQAALTAGGAHEQMAKTVEELKLEFGHLIEELETDLVPIFSVVIDDIKAGIQWGEKHKDVLEAMGKVVGVLVAAYIAYTTAVKIAAAADFLFGTSLAEMTVATEAQTVATGEATAAMTALDVVMDANPIGLMTVAIAGLAGAFALLSNNIDNATNAHNEFIADKNKDEAALKGASKAELEAKYEDIVSKIMNIEKYEQADEKKIGTYGHGEAEQNIERLVKEEKDQLRILTDERKDIYALMNPAQAAKSGPTKPSSSSLGIATPSPDSVKASDKQITNTWNIKEFGKTEIYPNHMNEGASNVHDKMLEALTTAVNDSEIASGQ